MASRRGSGQNIWNRHEDMLRACFLCGDRVRSLISLARGVEERWPFVLFVPQHAMLSPLRESPAYHVLLTSLGFRRGRRLR